VRVTRQLAQERRSGDRVVVLSHYPMRRPGLFPEKSWEHLANYCFPSVTGLVEAIRPVLVVQGHVHEWAGLSATLKLTKPERSVLVAMPGPAGMVVEIHRERAKLA
jgi:hypothetical protein